MKIRACPLCRQVMLIRNAATIRCGTCSFPMTRHILSTTAMSVMEESDRTTDFQRR